MSLIRSAAAIWCTLCSLSLQEDSVLEGEDLHIYKGMWDKAKQGDSTAQSLLGMDLFFGHNGVPMDEATGLQMLTKAADAGDRNAQDFMGGLLIRGHELAHDVKRGVEYAEKAAKQGSVKAMELLGNTFYAGNGLGHLTEEERMKKAFQWHLKAAEKGSLVSGSDVADYYRLGKGVKQDHKKAFRWHERIADNFQNLAGIDHNKPTAARNKTAIAKSLNTLGAMLHNGWGAERDDYGARKYFEKAAALGHAGAAKNAAALNEAEKERLKRKSAGASKEL